MMDLHLHPAQAFSVVAKDSKVKPEDGDSETSRLGKKLQGVMVVSAYALFHILLLNP